MNISDFISSYKNHPVIFVGTGVSLRYLSTSFTWNDLLKKVAFDLSGNDEYFLNLKSESYVNGECQYELIANQLEKDFTERLKAERDGKFKEVNDKFFELIQAGVKVSRFKVYVSMVLNSIETKPNINDELSEFKKIGKNIGSIITTNYDTFIENFFDFIPLIGNDILLSNPYGAVYKIHGCTSKPDKVIITKEDYDLFDDKYELIRAQLLSLFIHNPIIFIGYSVGDKNIKKILKTIFTYVDPNSDQASKIKNNFLLIEHHPGSDSEEISDHDIDIDGIPTIRINKIKTDNFSAIYKAISNLSLPISAMDIRKVQSIVKEIYSGGSIEVKITEDLDSLGNNEKILAIGSAKSIQYRYMTAQETTKNYFKIVEESNAQLIKLIDKYKINPTQYFPIFAFSEICPDLDCAERLKQQQIEKLQEARAQIPASAKNQHTSIHAILEDDAISRSYKPKAIFWAYINGQIPQEEIVQLLKSFEDFCDNPTEYNKLLSAYDHNTYSL